MPSQAKKAVDPKKGPKVGDPTTEDPPSQPRGHPQVTGAGNAHQKQSLGQLQPSSPNSKSQIPSPQKLGAVVLELEEEVVEEVLLADVAVAVTVDGPLDPLDDSPVVPALVVALVVAAVTVLPDASVSGARA
jgi:hypothetical protein